MCANTFGTRGSSPANTCTEHEEQRSFVQWFRRVFPGVVIMAIPNGGARGRATAGRLRAEGVVAGVPDLYVPAWALWIEMKRRRGGTVSPEQREMLGYLNGIGHQAVVCRGMDEAMAVVMARSHEVATWRI